MEEARLTGTGISTGIAAAPLFRLQNDRNTYTVPAVGDAAAETVRFYAAQAQTQKSLETLAEKTRGTVGEDAAMLFETHCELAEDPDFVDCVLQSIRDGFGAENAHQSHIPVTICGELGAEEHLLPLFLEMGIDEISVPPAKVLLLRSRLRQLS